MHPVIAELAAADLRARRLAEAELHRRLRATRHLRPSWRARQAQRLVLLAARLDPNGVGRTEQRPAAVC